MSKLALKYIIICFNFSLHYRLANVQIVWWIDDKVILEYALQFVEIVLFLNLMTASLYGIFAIVSYSCPLSLDVWFESMLKSIGSVCDNNLGASSSLPCESLCWSGFDEMDQISKAFCWCVRCEQEAPEGNHWWACWYRQVVGRFVNCLCLEAWCCFKKYY